MSLEAPSQSRIYLEHEAESLAEKLKLDPEQKTAVQRTIIETLMLHPPTKDEAYQAWKQRTFKEWKTIADQNGVSLTTMLAIKSQNIEENIEANWQNISEKAQKLEAERNVKHGTVDETAGLKREMLTSHVDNPDKQLIANITAFDVEKNISEQLENFERIRPVIYAIFAGLFQNGTPLASVQNLKDLPSLQLDSSKLQNDIEKATWKKLLEIAGNTDSKAFKDLESMRMEFTQNAYEKYGTASGVKKELTNEEREKTDEKTESMIEKTLGFVKDHPVITGIVLLAGAYGLYRLFSSKKDEKKESSSKLPWIIGGGIALTLFLTGKLFGVDNCLGWIMEKFDVSEEKRDKFRKLWNEGEYTDAFKTLFADDENEEAYGQMAAKASNEGEKIDSDALQKVANGKYDDFMSTTSEAQNMAQAAASNIEGVGGAVASALADSKQAKEEIKIRNHLKKNADKIKNLNLPKDATVGETLAALHNIPYKKAPSEKKEDLSGKKSFMEIMAKYSNYSTIMTHPFDFAKELSDACKKDDINILVGAGAIFVTDGVIMVPVAIGEAWCDVFTLQPGEYLKDSGIFIIGGAIKGYLNEKTILAAMKGAVKGATFPIRAPYMAAGGVYRGVKRIEETTNTVKGAKFRMERLAKNQPFIEAETQFFAQLAKKYDEAHEALEQTETTGKKLIAKLDAERIERLRTLYLKKFAESYTRQFPDKKIIVDSKDLKDSLRKTNETLREYLKNPTAAATAPTTSPQTSATTVPSSPATSPATAPQIAPATPTAPAAPNLMETATPEPLVYKPKPAFLETTLENGTKIHHYTFEGKNISLTETDIGRRATEIAKRPGGKANINTNWNAAIEELAAEKVKTTNSINGSRWNNEKLEIQIGEEWQSAETPKTPEARASLRQKFTEAFKQNKITKAADTFINSAKTIKYFGVLEKALGPTAAALTIYHLETAEDKEKAVAETAGTLGGFFAGMKLADWSFGKRTTNPAARAVIDLMGGIAGAFNLATPIEKIVTEYLEKIPAGKEVAGEIASIIETYSGYALAKKAAQTSLGKLTIERTATKMGLKTLGETFTKSFTGQLAKRISALAARQGFKTIFKIAAKEAAVAGAIATGVIANDVSGIGVADDVLLIPLAIWMGIDVVQAGLLIKNAYKMNQEMKTRENKDIAFFHINDKSSREALAKKLPPHINVDQLDELDEATFSNLLKDLPETTIDIIRTGTSGRERLTLEHGKVTHTAILDDNFEAVCELDNDDIDGINGALDMAEKKPKTTPAQIAESPSAPKTGGMRRGSI